MTQGIGLRPQPRAGISRPVGPATARASRARCSVTLRRACEADPACASFAECVRHGCPAPPCAGSCGNPPAAFLKRYVCQMNRCNVPACGGPVDACSLCVATRCPAEVLACQGQPGCGAYTTTRRLPRIPTAMAH